MAASALHRPLLFFHRPRVCPLSCHVQLRGPDFTCISTAFYVGYYPWGPCSTLHWLWGIAQTSLKLGEFIQTSHLCNIIISGWEGVAALLGNDKLYDSKFNHEFRQAVCFLLSVTPRVSEFVSIVWPCFLWMSDLGPIVTLHQRCDCDCGSTGRWNLLSKGSFPGGADCHCRGKKGLLVKTLPGETCSWGHPLLQEGLADSFCKGPGSKYQARGLCYNYSTLLF